VAPGIAPRGSHRSGRAELPHPALHGFAARGRRGCVIRAAGSGYRFSSCVMRSQVIFARFERRLSHLRAGRCSPTAAKSPRPAACPIRDASGFRLRVRQHSTTCRPVAARLHRAPCGAESPEVVHGPPSRKAFVCRARGPTRPPFAPSGSEATRALDAPSVRAGSRTSSRERPARTNLLHISRYTESIPRFYESVPRPFTGGSHRKAPPRRSGMLGARREQLDRTTQGRPPRHLRE